MEQQPDTNTPRPAAIPTHSHTHHEHHEHHHEHHQYKKYSWRWFRHKFRKLKYNKYFGKKLFAPTLALAMIATIAAVFLAINLSEEEAISAPQKISEWPDILKAYKDDPATNQLLFVKCDKETSIAEAVYYIKAEDGETWEPVSHGKAYIGVKGLGKRHEGDKKTPEGNFNVTGAFGIKENPGTKFNYISVNSYTIACDEDCEYYNQIIDIRRDGIHKGEMMMNCTPQYYYGMILDYNPNNVRDLGSNIFLHCMGYSRYTAGCVAIEESMMLEILSTATPGFKVCIHEK